MKSEWRKNFFQDFVKAFDKLEECVINLAEQVASGEELLEVQASLTNLGEEVTTTMARVQSLSIVVGRGDRLGAPYDLINSVLQLQDDVDLYKKRVGELMSKATFSVEEKLDLVTKDNRQFAFMWTMF